MVFTDIKNFTLRAHCVHGILLEGGEVSPPPAMGIRCVCTTGAVQNKARVQSKRRRKKLFIDMS